MEEKKKVNVGLIILMVILLIACIGMGCFIFINKDKLIEKENAEVAENMNKESEAKSDNNKEENTKEETVTNNISIEDDGKYIEKVYSMNNDSFIFFKSGNCVITSGLEYTAHCKYYVENNTINITSRSTGTSRGDEHNSIYKIVTDDNNDEYIELSTDSNKRYKYLKKYS